MNAFTDQQRMLADSARQFCAREHEPQGLDVAGARLGAPHDA